MQLIRSQRLEVEGVFLLLLFLMLFAYQETVVSLYRLWFDDANPTYSHGLLLLAVSAYFFVQRWVVLKQSFQLGCRPLAVLLLITVSCLWMLAAIGDIQVVQQLMILVLVLLLIYALFGWALMVKLAFPVLLMLCAMPVWDVFNIYLRQIAVVSVTLLLDLTGFLTVSEGFKILVPAGVFKVDTGCSGLNQFIVSCVVGLLYGYTRKLNVQQALLVVALSLGFAVLANIFRIYIVVVSGQLTDMQHYFVTTDHVMLGWVVYGVFMFAYLLLVERIGYLKPLPRKSQAGLISVGSMGISEQKKAVSVSLSVMAVMIGPLYLYYLTSQLATMKDLNTDRTINLPAAIQAWRSEQAVAKLASSGEWEPDIQSADFHGRTKYSSPAGSVELYVYRYLVQHQGKEAVHANNRLINDGWSEQSVRYQAITVDGHQLELRESLLVASMADNKLVWDWYYVNGVRTASPYMAKIMNIWGVLLGRPEITHYILAVDLSTAKVERLVLSGFLTDALVQIEGFIDDRVNHARQK